MFPNSSWLTVLQATAFILLIFLYKYSTRKLSYWKKMNVSGPKPIPWIGNMWKVISFQSSMGPLLKKLYDSEKGPIMGIFMFDDPVLLVRSIDIAKQILAKDFQFFSDRVAASPKHNQIVANIPFMQKNPEWRTLRMKVMPVFSPSKMKMMFHNIILVAEVMQSFVRKQPGVHEGRKLCYHYSTELVSQCFLGVSAHCFENKKSIIREKSQELFGFTMRNLFSQTAYFFKPNLVELFRLEFFKSSVQEFFTTLFWECVRKTEEGIIISTNFIALLNEIRREDPTFGRYVCVNLNYYPFFHYIIINHSVISQKTLSFHFLYTGLHWSILFLLHLNNCFIFTYIHSLDKIIRNFLFHHSPLFVIIT